MLYKNLIVSLLGLILFFTVFSRNAYAYLDPGSTSIFFQMLIASLLGALFAIKMFWKKIVYFLKGLFSKSKKDEKK